MEDVAARTLGRVAANGVELAYETFGAAGAPPVVLIMGLGMQMIAWPDELCEGLARRGLFVVRFDNRDTGESTHLRNLPPPRLADVVVRRRPPPYSISDMAADVAGLLDGLGLGEVHLVGASMGGFIAQTVALEYPGPSRARASWGSPAWGMTCPGRCGRSSSARSRRWPSSANSAGAGNRRVRRCRAGSRCPAGSYPGSALRRRADPGRPARSASRSGPAAGRAGR